jgi:hypothetical protein
MNTRKNPFATLAEASAFQTKQSRVEPVSDAAIEHIAENRNFPSREAPRSANKRVPRRYRTGRDQHVGIKTTAETRTRLYKAADERKVPLGVVLELALDALERAGGSNN